MKKVFMLLLVLVAFGASHIQATDHILLVTAQQIDIKSTTTSRGGVLRTAPAPAVSAWLVDSQITLTFLQDLGTVTITITNAQGVVYQTTVTATEDAELTIDVQGWEVGDYTIEIVRSSGQTFSGEFELQDENS